MKVTITAKKINSIYDAMENIGVNEVFFSKKKNSELLDAINDWFYKRKHEGVKRHVWGEGEYGKTSFVTEPLNSEYTYESRLRITFLDYL